MQPLPRRFLFECARPESAFQFLKQDCVARIAGPLKIYAAECVICFNLLLFMFCVSCCSHTPSRLPFFLLRLMSFSVVPFVPLLAKVCVRCHRLCSSATRPRYRTSRRCSVFLQSLSLGCIAARVPCASLNNSFSLDSASRCNSVRMFHASLVQSIC